MKNFKDSDYALNKYSDAIVYRFADGIIEVTLADFLAENPDKTPADFELLKKESDAIYFNQDRDDNAQTNKNMLLVELDRTTACYEQSPEESLINTINEQEENEKTQQLLAIANHVLDKLTDTQRRRYLLYVVNGLTMREIAEIDGVAHQSIVESLAGAEKKIKNFWQTAENTLPKHLRKCVR